MITEIKKWGNSKAIRIPSEYLKELNLSENSKVELIKENGVLIIKSIKKQETLEDLVSKINDDNKHSLVDFGKPVGKEIW